MNTTSTASREAALLEARADALVEAFDDLIERLIALRLRHGKTQKDVAERLGVSQAAVSQFEHEDSNPTIGSLRRYALAVGARVRFDVEDDCCGQAEQSWNSVVDSLQAHVAVRTNAEKRPLAEPRHAKDHVAWTYTTTHLAKSLMK